MAGAICTIQGPSIAKRRDIYFAACVALRQVRHAH